MHKHVYTIVHLHNKSPCLQALHMKSAECAPALVLPEHFLCAESAVTNHNSTPMHAQAKLGHLGTPFIACQMELAELSLK